MDNSTNDIAKRVVEFYTLCNRLKDIVRTGWKNWGVTRDRVESIAEHIYGTQMLAIAMWSEYKYKIDIQRVLSMLAIHELEETVIGDITMFQMDKKAKQELGHKAVADILKPLAMGESIKSLVLEFDMRETNEAKFAYYCDKLEADLQCKLYDEQNCVDLTKKVSNEANNDPYVKKVLEEEKTWSNAWLRFGQERYGYDDKFLEVSNYAKANKIQDDTNTKND